MRMVIFNLEARVRARRCNFVHSFLPRCHFLCVSSVTLLPGGLVQNPSGAWTGLRRGFVTASLPPSYGASGPHAPVAPLHVALLDDQGPF